MSKNEDFFPHPSNLRNHPNMLRLNKELPNATGYGTVVWLFEKLRSEEGFRYLKKNIDLLADESRISTAILLLVIDFSGFFVTDQDGNGDFFFSPLFNTLMIPYNERKKLRSQAGQISAKKKELKRLEQIKELENKLKNKLSTMDSTQQNPALLTFSEDDSTQQIREDIDHSSHKKKFYKEKKHSTFSSFRKSKPNQIIETDDAIIAIHKRFKTTRS